MRFRTWIADNLRPLEQVLAEQFAYGHREVILSRLGIDLDNLILGELQHGWATNTRYLAQSSTRKRDRIGRLFPLYLWSDLLKTKLENAGQKKVKVIGSPWAILVEHEEKLSAPSSVSSDFNTNILYFPSHSFFGAVTSMQRREALENLFNSYNNKKIYVCLYWLDFINPKIRLYFEELGFKVTCVGYRGAASGEFPWIDLGGLVGFLPKLFELLQKAELVYCDEVSTAFWAACSLGKRVSLTTPQVVTKSYWGNEEKIEVDGNLRKLHDASVKISSIVPGEIISEVEKLKEISRRHFGWEHISSTSASLELKTSEILRRTFNKPEDILSKSPQT